MDISWLNMEAIGLTFILTYTVRQVIYRKFRDRKVPIFKWKVKKPKAIWMSLLIFGAAFGALYVHDAISSLDYIKGAISTVIGSAGIHSSAYKHLPWLPKVVDPEKTEDNDD